VAALPTASDFDAGISDAGLVLAARAGDRTALPQLIARHRALVLAMCRRVLGSSHLAEDAVQEACLQAMLGLDALRDPQRFGPWLVGIALNVCRHLLRQPTVDSLFGLELSGGWSASGVAAREPGPEDLAESADIAARVRGAVLRLPPGQRSAVIGFYLSGLTYRETAAELGLGVTAVRTRLHKARASLRADLRSLWEEAMDTTDLVEMRVADVRRSAPDAEPASYLVLLEEINGGRHLPIWVGPHEGMILARLLEQLELPRPLGPQFMFNALQAVGARVTEVRIDRLAEKTFYAVAVIEGGDGPVEVDARPSDALSAALLAGARVTARRELLDAPEDVAATMMENLAEKFPESAHDIVGAELSARAGRDAHQPSPASSTPA
jgi:RNA polymerase sigma-70 factor (ECF subfamily)